MFHLSDTITHFLLKSEAIKQDEREIYIYGYEVIISTFMDIIALLVIGTLCRRICETLVFIVVFVSVRQYTGGLHAHTKAGCVFITTMTLCVSFILNTFIINSRFRAGYCVVACLAALMTAIWRAPVENDNKPLDREEKMRYKRAAIGIITFYAVIIGIFIYIKPFYAVNISTILLEICLLMIIKLRKEI